MDNSDPSNKSRLFIAIHIIPTPKLINILSEFKAKLHQSKIKWVNEQNMHLTLHFLGDVNNYYINSLNQTLSETANKYSSAKLILKGIGYFKRNNKPTVIWVGINKNDTLNRIYLNLKNSLDNLGINHDNKSEYKPHLTLGRIKYLKDKSPYNELISKYSDIQIGEELIKEIILYKSELKQEGPVYTSLGRHSLQD